MGKNTQVIVPGRGSWFFLAVVLTTLPLPPDEPRSRQDPCGSCTRCLEACPTGALLAPYEVDARRCISYLTIEHQGAFPLELRRRLGDRIFGCDACQSVCPHNQRRHPPDPAFEEIIAGTSLSLSTLIELVDDSHLARLLPRSPLRRAGRDRLVRNACIAMGNSGDPGYLPALKRRASEDGDEAVREHARWAIDRLG